MSKSGRKCAYTLWARTVDGKYIESKYWAIRKHTLAEAKKAAIALAKNTKPEAFVEIWKSCPSKQHAGYEDKGVVATCGTKTCATRTAERRGKGLAGIKKKKRTTKRKKSKR